MIIHRWFSQNALRNFQHIGWCEKTRDAFVIDPLEPDSVLRYVWAERLNLKFILNTHEHHDHIAGNEEVQKATGAAIAANSAYRGKIPGLNYPLKENQELRIGEEIHTRVQPLPGHTLSHTGFMLDNILFSGDAVFNAGCGHCRLGGDVKIHFKTFRNIILALPNNIHLYPGHEYLLNNLKFALHVEPENDYAEKLSRKAEDEEFALAYQATLGEERKYNPFFRLGSLPLRKQVSILSGEDLLNAPDEKIFIVLRELRNHW